MKTVADRARAFACRMGWIKHARGVRLKPTDPPHVPGDQNVIRYQCPRCGATWTRKLPKPKSEGK